MALSRWGLEGLGPRAYNNKWEAGLLTFMTDIREWPRAHGGANTDSFQTSSSYATPVKMDHNLIYLWLNWHGECTLINIKHKCAKINQTFFKNCCTGQEPVQELLDWKGSDTVVRAKLKGIRHCCKSQILDQISSRAGIFWKCHIVVVAQRLSNLACILVAWKLSFWILAATEPCPFSLEETGPDVTDSSQMWFTLDKEHMHKCKSKM